MSERKTISILQWPLSRWNSHVRASERVVDTWDAWMRAEDGSDERALMEAHSKAIKRLRNALYD